MLRAFILYGQPNDPAAFDRDYRDTHIGLAQRFPGLRRYTMSTGRLAHRVVTLPSGCLSQVRAHATAWRRDQRTD